MSKFSCTGAPIFRLFNLFPVGLLLFLLTSTFCLGASDEWIIPDKDSPLEAKLAVIYTGQLMVRQSQIDEWKLILDRLSGKCRNDTRQKVSDLILTAHKLLKNRDSKLDQKEVARILDESIPPSGAGLLDCHTLFSTTVTREVTGMDRLKLDKAPY